MKTYNVPESFILEAHKEACDKWKKKIESIAPDLFQKLSFKVGEWVSMDDGRGSALICYQGKDNNHCGFNWAGEWTTCFGNTTLNDCPEQCRLATKEEIEKHLIAEAEKRGFKAGVKIRSLLHEGDHDLVISDTDFEYLPCQDKLHCTGTSFRMPVVYLEGKWATILEEPKPIELSMQEIAEKFGVDVNLLKIKK